MADHLTPEKRSAIMSAIRSKNTKPEVKVRHALHRLGYRFQIHDRRLPGKPDIVFTKRRKIIFIHGCYWHQHADPNCRDTKKPTSNLDYWLPKLDRTNARDKQQQNALNQMGWKILVLWECEVSTDRQIEQRLVTFLGPRRWK